MLDYNHTASFADQLNAMIDTALVKENQAEPSREYLGGSQHHIGTHQRSHDKGLHKVFPQPRGAWPSRVITKATGLFVC